MNDLKTLCEHYHDRFLSFFLDAPGVIIIAVSKDNGIFDCNETFIRLMGLISKPDGRDISDYLRLTNDSPLDLRAAEETGGQMLKSVHTGGFFFCRGYPADDGFVIIGEILAEDNSDILLKMSDITSELTNLSRNLRKKRDELEALNQEKNILIGRLEKALADVRTLRGLLPICSNCKNIKNDEGYWQAVEEYVEDHSNAAFTHGLCPSCLTKLYPEYAEEILKSIANPIKSAG